MRLFTLNVLVMLTSVFTAGAAYGSGGEHGEGGFSSLIPYWVNLCIYVALLYFLLNKKAKAGWEKRSAAIEAAVNKGADELKSAQQELSQAKAELAKLDGEIRSITDQIGRDAENESKKILEDAQKRSEEILARARDLAASESRAFSQQLRKEVAELVISRATEKVRGEWSTEKDRPHREAVVKSMTTAEVLHTQAAKNT